MCGRFVLDVETDVLEALFGLKGLLPLPKRYNIAPTQPIFVVRTSPDRGEGREPAMLRWGLIPHWAKEKGIGARMINARAETIAAKPAFRGPFRYRRCLVPMTAFYEWAKAGRRKQPYLIRMENGRPFAVAAVWDRWTQGDQVDIETCAILTTGANALVRPIHSRMPVILRQEDWDLWLDSHVTRGDRLQQLLRPIPPDGMVVYPVDPYVNDPRHDDPRCIEPCETGSDIARGGANP